ncbi:MAG: tRNA (adenosine(37)-N6)-dimethylallyltransferase MiaA [Desulfurivibrio sp.]|nr:tRNA (adenosine(37)-N6)-dimethylallyltransferase MiaA [Desulfurivibrio sp.]
MMSKSCQGYSKKQPETTDFCLLGATAVGKTDLALELAARFEAEIVSVDAMQVYRGLDIGTAKPGQSERKRIRHHLIDIVDPDEDYHLARFLRDAAAARQDIHRRGKVALFTGGTGLYFKGLFEGIFAYSVKDLSLRDKLQQRLAAEGHDALYAELSRVDPASAARLAPGDSQRLLRALEIFQDSGIPWSEHLRRSRQRALLSGGVPVIGLWRPREELYERINRRVDEMLAAGLLDEVSALLARGYAPELPAMKAIGYRQLVDYLQGDGSLATARELLARDTRRYAKRQLTWFNGMSNISWFAPDDVGGITARIRERGLPA